MRQNAHIKVIGNRIILVPYRKDHVPKYHCWMQSKELQELTASEPLTEEEEFHMQQTWLNDENKCTFIVLEKELYQSSGSEEMAMIGDINLYLIEVDRILTAETSVMIAEESVRGKGRGKEAVLLMLRYGANELNVKKFIAKISLSNEASIKLFQKLGFEVESESAIFQEITLSVDVSQKWYETLEEHTKYFCIQAEA